jgi:hypothetical protein
MQYIVVKRFILFHHKGAYVGEEICGGIFKAFGGGDRAWKA